jgi:hypothetical protein
LAQPDLIQRSVPDAAVCLGKLRQHRTTIEVDYFGLIWLPQRTPLPNAHWAGTVYHGIQEFFIAYYRLRGRKFKPLALTGPDKSRELIKAGMDGFKKQNHQRIELA